MIEIKQAICSYLTISDDGRKTCIASRPAILFRERTKVLNVRSVQKQLETRMTFKKARKGNLRTKGGWSEGEASHNNYSKEDQMALTVVSIKVKRASCNSECETQSYNFCSTRSTYISNSFIHSMYDLTHTNTCICVCERRGYSQKTVWLPKTHRFYNQTNVWNVALFLF